MDLAWPRHDLSPGESQVQPGEDQRPRLVQPETGETETCQWWEHSELWWSFQVEVEQRQAGLEEGRGEHLVPADQQR